MSNRLQALLNHWFPEKDSCQWVLASIIETQRSSYRKAGAMMLINSLGKSYGLLSGGCLEADLMRQAQKCWQNNTNITVCYDMQDDDDIAWQLGIGCGGLVKVLLQPVDHKNNYLDLLNLKSQLDNRNSCFYHLDTLANQNRNQVVANKGCSLNPLIEIKPAPALVIFGGGLDTLPLVNIAHTLGWYTCLIDSRTSYARPAYFKNADKVINKNYNEIEQSLILPKADAVIIMHHNVLLDARALQLVKNHNSFKAISYLGLLGPQHRTDKVMDEAKLSTDELPSKLANPIGLDLGGELPESIALSILAQAHACIEGTSGKSLGHFTNVTSTSIKQAVNHAS